MVRVYICEDDPRQLDAVKRHVGYYASFSEWQMKVAVATQDPQVILQEVVVDEEANVYIFDIDLNTSELNGFHLARQIRQIDPNGYLIYLTNHLELSYLTFQFHVNAIDYIEKNGAEEWEVRLTNCLKEIEKRLQISEVKQKQKAIELYTFYGSTFILLEEIIAFEAQPDHKICLYLTNQKVTILQTTMDKLEKELGPGFLRIHRSFIINRDKIREIEGDHSSVRMVNQLEVPVSFRRRKVLRDDRKREVII